MDGRKFQFLKAVLGEDGAKALSKAAERAPELGHAVLPRTIMAWLGVATRDDFEGTIPGVQNTYLQFTKSESKYSGSVSVGDEVYSFEAATILHLGACVAVALGSDHERMSPGLRDLDIQRLGKNIDTLVKARLAIAEIRKRALEATVTKAQKSPQGGAEAPGPAHAATPPLAPLAPQAPAPTQTSKGPVVGLRPKPPKLPTPKAATDQTQTSADGKSAPKSKAPTLKVTKAQSEVECPVCGVPQFKADRFLGCICMRDLAKSASATVTPDGYLLKFSADWDQDAILTLIESLGRK